MKYLVSALLLTVSCFRDHPPSAVELQAQDCYTCHQPEYEATTAPPHVTLKCPTTCDSCHTNVDWTGGIECAPHPEQRWPITTGAHQGIKCRDCHVASLGPSAGGGNTDCIGCHTGDHAQAKSAAQHQTIQGYAWANSACRQCHPNGTSGHPELKFPIKTGKHTGIACGDCHDRQVSTTDNKANTTCIGCHTHSSSSQYGDDHQDVGGAPAWPGDTPHFCANAGCHPTGQRSGG